MTKLRAWPWIALAVVVIGALFVATRDDGGPTTVNDRVRSIGSELRCPDCQSQSVAISSTASARAVRADIRRRVEAGQSDGEIKRAFVDSYGESFLLKPSGSGLGWIVWGLPVLAFVLVLMIAILYYATPNAQQPKFRWVSAGSLIALFVLLLAYQRQVVGATPGF